MKTLLVSTLFASSFMAVGVGAQTPAQPAASSPPAATTVDAATPTSQVSAPAQIIYAPRLPTAAELTNAAAAQGLTVDKIEQASAQVTVVYRYGNGQTSTIAYQLLPSAGMTSSGVVQPSAPPVVAQGSPAVVYQSPAVVYQSAPRVVYYDAYDPLYYPYPRYWYPPVSLNLGFGFRSGFYHHGRR